MQSRILDQVLARIAGPGISGPCEDVFQDLYRRGVRFPTGKMNNVVMPFFENEHLKTVTFVLKKHGFVEKRAPHEGEQFFTDGKREARLFHNVPEYYTGMIGLMT